MVAVDVPAELVKEDEESEELFGRLLPFSPFLFVRC